MADTALIVVPHRDIRSVEENCSLGGGMGLLGMASPAANVDALDGSGRGRGAESASQGHGLELSPSKPSYSCRWAAEVPPRVDGPKAKLPNIRRGRRHRTGRLSRRPTLNPGRHQSPRPPSQQWPDSSV